MHRIVIADTSCLIVLSKLNLFHLLQQLYTEVVVTPKIADEFVSPLPEWVLIRRPENSEIQKRLENQLDQGEASALALALELNDCLLILDDLHGRKVAAALNLEFTGTLGVLVRAKQLGHLPAVKPILDLLKEIKFRISSDVEKFILNQCNE